MIETIIEPDRTIRHLWRELCEYRELFLFLAWKDILIRYKQTVIGAAWSVLRPLVLMVVLTVVFGWIAGLESGAVPYAVMVFAAMLPWQFFGDTLSKSSESVVANAGMVSKVYFPRIIIPTTTMIVSLVDFLISFVIFILLLAGYGFWPNWKMVFVPPLLLLAAVTSLGLGYWFAALNVRYRDFRSIVPFVVQLGLFASPVGFSSDVIAGKWRLVYSLNPMVGVIDGFRWALLGGEAQLYVPGFLISIGLSAALFAGGVIFFTRTERSFADVI